MYQVAPDCKSFPLTFFNNRQFAIVTTLMQIKFQNLKV